MKVKSRAEYSKTVVPEKTAATPKVKTAMTPSKILPQNIFEGNKIKSSADNKDNINEVDSRQIPTNISDINYNDDKNRKVGYYIVIVVLVFLLSAIVYYLLKIDNDSSERMKNSDSKVNENSLKMEELKKKEIELEEKEKQLNKEIERKRDSETKTGNINYDGINGTYAVGDLTCSVFNRENISWNKGSGFNKLHFISGNDENILYSEYSNGNNYSGTFTFYKNFAFGKYERADGVIFDVKKIR